MIAVDTNILVACHRLESPQHDRAAGLIRELAESPLVWAIPWPCVHEFLAVVTSARIFRQPSSLAVAVEVIEVLMESPSLRLLHEGPAYWSRFREIAGAGAIAGPRIHDARIAALCLVNGVKELWTADRDFSRFPALRCRNPLI